MNDEQTDVAADKKQIAKTEQSSRNNCRLFPIGTYITTNSSESLPTKQQTNNQHTIK